jgi:hypothetical protein
MQIVAGRADDTMTMREVIKRVPSRLIRFLLRVASLQKGRYMVHLTVSDDDFSFSVCPIERVER